MTKVRIIFDFPSYILYHYKGQDIVARIVICYRLDCLGIEFWWGPDLLYLCGLALGPTQPPIQWVSDLFPGVKQSELGIDRPTHLATLLLTLSAFVACSMVNFNFVTSLFF